MGPAGVTEGTTRVVPRATVAADGTPAPTEADGDAGRAGPADRGPGAGGAGGEKAVGEGAGPDARGLAYAPGLDGLRALSLLGVLAFHHRFAWASGGFLGVSTFFTLSGFLIARLALAEWGRTGGLSVGGFWERRARRLLPAALVTLAGIALVQWTLGVGGGPSLRGDLLASLAYGANWRFLASSGDYAALFADPSPVAHMWSLAIEEQFYLAFPLVFALVMRLVGGRAGRGAAVFAGLAAASFVAARVASAGGSDNTGVAYYATHTRAGEVLLGVVAAFAITTGPARRALAHGLARVAGAVAVPVGIAGLAVLWHGTTLGGPALFRGVTLLNGLLTVLLVVALTLPARPGPAPRPGPAADPADPGGAPGPGAALGGLPGRVLGVAPLRRLGQVSYGAYLLHWPVFLVLDAERTGIDTLAPLFALRLAVTIALAAAMYALVEAPVRFRLRVPRARLAAGLAAAAVATAALIVAVPVRTPEGRGMGVAGATEATADGWTVPADEPGAPRALLLGDSVAWSIGPAFTAWNEAHATGQLAVEGYTPFGCPLGGHDVPLRIFGDGEWAEWDECARWHAALPGIVAGTDADVVVFTSGVFELGERQFAGDWYHLGDGPYDAWLRDRLGELADLLTSPGVPVVWTTFPHVRLNDRADPTAPWQELAANDPARVDRLNALVREVVADHPGIRLADLDAWTRTLPGGEFAPALRDGAHYTWGAAPSLAAWLVPEVTSALRGSG